MKRLFFLTIFAAATSVVIAQFGMGTDAGQARGTIVFHADGSVTVTNDNVQSRAGTEQQVRMWDRWRGGDVDADDVVDEPVREATPKPYTDDELAKKLRETTKKVRAAYNAATEPGIARLTIATNTVQIVITQSFASLKDFMAVAPLMFGQAGISIEQARLEMTNDQLRFTLTPHAGMKRYVKTMRDQMKLSGGTNEFTLVFPGKVVSSALPKMQDNTTGFALNTQDDDSVNAVLKLYESATVIVCEPGGLKLDGPLDSRLLARHSRSARAGVEDDLPITGAGPGFVAEPVSVTTTTVYLFPSADKQTTEGMNDYTRTTGTVVHAKLFAPKGRTLRGVTGIKVIKAVDDKGRSLVGQSEEVERDLGMFGSGGPERGSMAFQLRLALPAPDAESVSEVTAEAVATTVGKWNEITITNAQANSTNEIDLGAVLPGAKLVLKKITAKQRQFVVEAQLKGPKEVRRLDLQARWPGKARGNSSAYDRGAVSTKDNETTRTVQMNAYSYDQDSTGTPAIVVRFPADLKRERVQITLSNLDLL